MISFPTRVAKICHELEPRRLAEAGPLETHRHRYSRADRGEDRCPPAPTALAPDPSGRVL